MARVKRGVVAHAKHKKVLEQAKGFYGRRKNTIRTAKAAVDKAGQYAYRDRKVRTNAWMPPQELKSSRRKSGAASSSPVTNPVLRGPMLAMAQTPLPTRG